MFFHMFFNAIFSFFFKEKKRIGTINDCEIEVLHIALWLSGHGQLKKVRHVQTIYDLVYYLTMTIKNG